jgi:hypothetical protein
MDPEVREGWAADMERRGVEGQCYDQLADGDGQVCALGSLSEWLYTNRPAVCAAAGWIYDPDFGKWLRVGSYMDVPEVDWDPRENDDEIETALPVAVCNAIGLHSDGPQGFEGEATLLPTQENVIRWNDSEHLTFATIARRVRDWF